MKSFPFMEKPQKLFGGGYEALLIEPFTRTLTNVSALLMPWHEYEAR